jgi:hypothetical protein
MDIRFRPIGRPGTVTITAIGFGPPPPNDPEAGPEDSTVGCRIALFRSGDADPVAPPREAERHHVP